MSKERLTKLDGDLKLAGYAKRSRQSYVRAVRQLMNLWSCKLEEIDSKRMCVEIRDAKGDDRIVPLPESTLELLREWWKGIVMRALCFPPRAVTASRALRPPRRWQKAPFFGVMHTWGRQLQYHPHVHFVIPGVGRFPRSFLFACVELPYPERQASYCISGGSVWLAFRSHM